MILFQGYFRKGCALFGLGKYEDSVVALLQCLALDTSIDTAREYLSKVSLDKHYAPLQKSGESIMLYPTKF